MIVLSLIVKKLQGGANLEMFVCLVFYKCTEIVLAFSSIYLAEARK